MRQVLTDIFVLFYRANPLSPYGANKRAEFENNKQLYSDKCRKYTMQFAINSGNTNEMNRNWFAQ